MICRYDAKENELLESAKFSNRFLMKAFLCVAFAQIILISALVLESFVHKDFTRTSHCPVI
jgi:hypothetical protein